MIPSLYTYHLSTSQKRAVATSTFLCVTTTLSLWGGNNVKGYYSHCLFSTVHTPWFVLFGRVNLPHDKWMRTTIINIIIWQVITFKSIHIALWTAFLALMALSYSFGTEVMRASTSPHNTSYLPSHCLQMSQFQMRTPEVSVEQRQTPDEVKKYTT